VSLQKPFERVVVGARIVEVAQVTGVRYLDTLDSRKLQGELPGKPFAAIEIEFTVDHQGGPAQRFEPCKGHRIRMPAAVGEVPSRIARDHARQQRMGFGIHGSKAREGMLAPLAAKGGKTPGMRKLALVCVGNVIRAISRLRSSEVRRPIQYEARGQSRMGFGEL